MVPSRLLHNVQSRAGRARSAFVLAMAMLGAAGHVAAATLGGDNIEASVSTTANRAPSFGTAFAARSVAENTVAGQAIGTSVRATDPDPGDTLTYSLEDTDDAAAFDIDEATGQLLTSAPLDHESRSSYSITMIAQDDQGASATITVTISVSDGSEPPRAPDAPTVGRVVGAPNSLGVRWTAPDNTGRPVIESYDVQYRTPREPWWSMPPKNVTDTAATLTHLLRNTLYEVQVRAKNADGDGPWSESGWGTTGKNTAPSFGATSTTRSVAENTEPGQAIADPVTATDPDSGDTLSYSLEDTDDAAAFDIDEATGQLLTSAALDYETQASYSVTVVARDTDGADASIHVTISVTDEDENEPPSFDSGSTTRSVAENTPAGHDIGAPVQATDPDSGDTLSYSLEDTDDAAAFDIDEATGQLLTGAALDYETQASYSVTVVAEDSRGASATIEVTISVTDEDENEPPSFDSDSTTRSVAENTPAGHDIGAPVQATDPDSGDTLTYSLEDTDDAAAFDIDEATGQLLTGAALDYETQASYSVTVVAEDSQGASATIEVTISVTDEDENEPPSFDSDSTTRSVAENTPAGHDIGAPVQATDPDSGDTLTYSLEDTDDAAAFDIDEATGQLLTSAALDYETQASYSVTVVAEDSQGASATIEVTISVTDEDENEPPSFDSDSTTRSVAENTPAGHDIGAPVQATDPDSGDTLTYSLEDTDDAAAFDIDEATGQLLTSAALDYETQASYSVTVVAEDSQGASATIEVTISVTDEDENEPPSFDSDSTTRSVAENTPAGHHIGAPVQATDPDSGDTLSYSLEDADDAAAFDIDETTGQLLTSAALDYETQASYSVTVVAEDSRGASATIEVTISVTDEDENEPPSFDSDSTTRSVAENTPAGHDIGAPVQATDPDSGDTLSYSLEDTDDAAAFDIDEATGQLLTSAALDYETQASYSVTVVAEDSQGASATIEVTISVTDEDENEPPSFDSDSTTRSVAENTPAGHDIGAPVQATDPDSGDTLSYSLEDADDAAAFDIDEATGQLLTSAALDYETRSSYSVTVAARDTDGAGDSIEVTIEVTDANDAPSFDSTDNMRSVAENTEPGQAIGDPVTATDPDSGDTLSYSLEDTGDAAAFDIDAATGQLLTGAALNREEKSSYSVTVVAEDSGGESATTEVTIAVTDVNEPPSFDSDSTTRSVAENTPAGHDIGEPVQATDPDSDETLTYRLEGADADAFDINSTTGQLRTSAPLNREEKSSYSVTVVAEDSHGESATIEITIAVTDVNEPPSFDSDATKRSVTENTPAGHDIGEPVTATDPDSHETLTYRLEGADADAFDIDSTTGQLRTSAPLDNETQASYSVTVVAEDSHGESATIEVTIAVTDVNEPPSFDSDSTTRSVAENTPARHDIGEPVQATDPDSHETLTYSLGGSDAAAFDIVPTSGQLRTGTALDHEAKPSYSVAVTVEDSRGVTASIAVTIAVTDENEPPGAPEAPTFVSVTDESLTVRWTPPSTAGRPDITSYDLRYRTGTSSAFADGPQDVTGTTATISGLSPNVAYHVEVRATNDEGDGPWSAPGTTITTNDEALQKAWLAQFGRTVAGQVVNAVSARLEGDAGVHVTVGGTKLRLSSGTLEARQQLAQARPDHARQDVEAVSGTPGATERALAPGSSFHLASDAGPAGSPALTAWGRYASESFRSADGQLELDGEVATAVLGADAEWDRLLAGVAVSFSDGEGEFGPGHAASPGKGEGTLDSTLNSVHPYLRYEVKEGVSVWGLAGYGSGHLTHADDGARPIDTDITMRLGALGARSELLTPSQESGLGLALKSDLFWMRMESEAVEEPDGRGLKRAEARSTRVRLLLEGSQSFELESAAVMTPSLEVGLRGDGGDGETGGGVEVRAGIRYTAPGMTIEASAHSLFGHQRREYEEWGANGSIRVAPGTSGRGVSLTVAPSWGTVESGADSLWSMQDTRRLAQNGGIGQPRSRLEAEVGYGVGAPGGHGVLTPYAGLSLLNDAERSYRIGGRWNVAPAFSMSLEGDRREQTGEDAPEHIVMLRGAMRW